MSLRRLITFATVYAVLLSSFSLAYGATFTSNDVPKAIPDFANGVPGMITSTLTVPSGACSSVTDVNVSVNITHPFVQDLAVSVTHNGTGKSAILFQDFCTIENDLITTFDDEGAVSILQCPNNGVYQPIEPLSVFDGIDPTGTWTLTVTDQSNLDAGTLNSWGISLTCGGSSQPVSILGGGYYISLQAAYNAPGPSGITIQAQAVDLAALGFTLNSGKSVTLEGGFDSAFSVNSGGYTVLTGVLTIQTGSLTVENLIIK
jgi:subtilisin-like proprotein convertase family protein